jgi:MFS family permease
MITAPRTRDLFADRRFLVFWVAQAISKFGDPITLIALAVVTYQMTGSAFYTSLAVLVTNLPRATFGFLAGAIADGAGHRRSMVVADLIRAVLIGAVPLILAADLPLGVAYLAVMAAQSCAAVFNPARMGFIATLLSGPRLVAGNSTVYATDRTVEVLGALGAGLLVALVGQYAFYVDAATFAVSALLLSRIAIGEPPPRGVSWTDVWRGAAEGLSFIRRTERLYANTVFSLLAQLSLPVFDGLLPVLIFRRFADGDTDLGAELFGASEAAMAAGAVLSAILLPRVLRRFKKGNVVVAGFAAYGVAVLLTSITRSFELLIATVALAGVANVLFLVPNMTISQELAPAGMRARVFGARSALLSLTWLPMMLAAGALADRFPIALLIGLAGAFTLLIALAATQIAAVNDVP